MTETTLDALSTAGTLTFSDGYRTRKDQLARAGIPILRVADMGDGLVTLATGDRVADSFRIKMGLKTSRTNDVLVSTKGTVGRIAYVPENFPEHVYSPQLCFLRVLDQSVLDSRWLYFWARSPAFLSQVAMYSGQTDMAPYLSLRDLASVSIDVPPLDEQRRIAGVLGALDDLIEVNLGLARHCDELAEALWLRATSGVSSEMTVADCATVVLGGTPSRKEPSYWGGDVAWLNSGKANDFRVIQPSEFITTLGQSKSSTKMMPKGSTIIAITGATLGQVSRIEIPACGNQSLVGVWAEEPALNDFIYFGVRSRIDVLLRSATGGAQQHVNKANVEELTLPWITESKIEAWHQAASPLLDATAELLFEAQSLANTRDELLPLLMSGRVRVREDGVAA